MGKKSEAKKSDTKKSGKRSDVRCGSCRNFDPDKKGGYCRQHDKKRSADDKTCGHFKAR